MLANIRKKLAISSLEASQLKLIFLNLFDAEKKLVIDVIS